jgi:hypothetical protein
MSVDYSKSITLNYYGLDLFQLFRRSKCYFPNLSKIKSPYHTNIVVDVCDEFKHRFPLLQRIDKIRMAGYDDGDINNELYYYCQSNVLKVRAAEALYLSLQRVYKTRMDKNMIKHICKFVLLIDWPCPEKK